jgi:hypothetical protein
VAFRPRVRDLRVAFGEARRAAERRSHATLGLARSCTAYGAVRDNNIVSHDPFTGVSPPTTVPARPPFTLTATLFGALRASLFEAWMLPIDFCNCIRRTGTHRSSRFLAGTMASTTFLF